MRQHIQFCTSADGTRIAYATMGSGPPLVRAASWMTHLEHDATNPITVPYWEEFARDHTFIRYDLRGHGLSERNVEDMSFAAWVNDLEAVVDAAGLDRFSLVGMSAGGPLAIAYTAHHANRVEKLMLHGAFVKGIRIHNLRPEQIEQIDALNHMVEVGWGTKHAAFRQIFSALLIPSGNSDQWQWWNELQRQSSSGRVAASALQTMQGIDVRDLAPRVTCPTLVTHSTGDTSVPFAEGRLTASLIPHAKLVAFEDRNHILIKGDPSWTEFVEEFRKFFGTGAPSRPLAAAQPAFPQLSARETEVLDLIARGMDNDQIAARLELSPKTVRNHITSIFSKLEIYTRSKAVVIAREAGLGLTPIR
ncbi:alpha/beta fold hydrolase [Noviherbaspirillum sp. L7-7A]|nr:alpha/beta fold hydrolase [Noviherbaspirillum sp. L7-7A]